MSQSYDEIVSDILRTDGYEEEPFSTADWFIYQKSTSWTPASPTTVSSVLLEAKPAGKFVDFSKSYILVKFSLSKSAGGALTAGLYSLSGSAYSLIRSAKLEINGDMKDQNLQPALSVHIRNLLTKSAKQIEQEAAETLYYPIKSTQGIGASETGTLTALADQGQFGLNAVVPPTKSLAAVPGVATNQGWEIVGDSQDLMGLATSVVGPPATYTIANALNQEFVKSQKRLQVAGTKQYYDGTNGYNGIWVKLYLSDLFGFCRQNKVLPITTSVRITLEVQTSPVTQFTRDDTGTATDVGATWQDCAYMQFECTLNDRLQASYLEAVKKGAKIPISCDLMNYIQNTVADTSNLVSFSASVPYVGTLKYVMVYPQSQQVVKDETRNHLISGCIGDFTNNFVTIDGSQYPKLLTNQGSSYGYLMEYEQLKRMSSIPMDESFLSLQRTFIKPVGSPLAIWPCFMYPILCYDVSHRPASQQLSQNSSVIGFNMQWSAPGYGAGGNDNLAGANSVNYYMFYIYEHHETLDPLTGQFTTV